MIQRNERPNTALLIIDVQNKVVANAHRRTEVVANIRSWKHSGFSVDQSVRLDAGEAIEPEEQLRDIRDKGTKGQRDKGTKD